MTLQEETFYSKIGLISVEFSNLESQIQEMIGLLINSDDEFINLILIEDNNISQNLKLLLKLNKYRSIQDEKIKLLHSSINKLRINRNIFIHGLWTKFETKQNEIVFVCEIKKVEFKEGSYGISSYRNKFLEFKIEDFEKEIIEIKACSQIATELLISIKKERF